MRCETLLVSVGTILGVLGVGCEVQTTAPALLPTVLPTVEPVAGETHYQAIDLEKDLRPTKVSPPPAPREVFLPPEFPFVDLKLPRLRQEIREETLIAVEPNDIIGQKFVTQPTRLADDRIVLEKTRIAVVLHGDGRRHYLWSEQARVYFDRGVTRPSWLSVDGLRKYIVTPDGKFVKGGPLASSETTYITIRHYDVGNGGKFSGQPAVNADGYVVTIKNNGEELDVGEEEPHHGGTFWKAPAGWKILAVAFGVHQRKGDLLITFSDTEGKTWLSWLVNAIPEFPPTVAADCSSARHRLNDCKMRLIRDHQGKVRPEELKPHLVPVVGGDGIFDASVIWNQYPR